jgi:hypothetical protein
MPQATCKSAGDQLANFNAVPQATVEPRFVG